jgi:hypothetical protein
MVGENGDFTQNREPGPVTALIFAPLSDKAVQFPIGVKDPRQQLTDAIDGVIGDSGQNLSQVGFWITVVQLCCSYQAIDRSCLLSSCVRASE